MMKKALVFFFVIIYLLLSFGEMCIFRLILSRGLSLRQIYCDFTVTLYNLTVIICTVCRRVFAFCVNKDLIITVQKQSFIFNMFGLIQNKPVMY